MYRVVCLPFFFFIWTSKDSRLLRNFQRHFKFLTRDLQNIFFFRFRSSSSVIEFFFFFFILIKFSIFIIVVIYFKIEFKEKKKAINNGIIIFFFFQINLLRFKFINVQKIPRWNKLLCNTICLECFFSPKIQKTETLNNFFSFSKWNWYLKDFWGVEWGSKIKYILQTEPQNEIITDCKNK